MEALWLRTDPVYRTVARRWPKVMLALFAVGVVTGTILSFELGLLWPGFMATFGEVFGLGFTLEAFSFFIEAIFIVVYIYGWDRLSARAHFLAGIPVLVAGVTGSLMVISVTRLQRASKLYRRSESIVARLWASCGPVTSTSERIPAGSSGNRALPRSGERPFRSGC